MTSSLSRSMLQRNWRVLSCSTTTLALRSLSSTTSNKVDHLVSGVTSEMIAADPVLADYMRANFPEHFETQEEKESRQRFVTNWGERRRNTPKPPLNIRPMAAAIRTEEGSNACFPMREQGFIPGILYGGDPTQQIDARDYSKRLLVKTPSRIIQSEIDRFHYHAFQGRVYDLTVYETEEQLFDEEGSEGGTVHRVVPRDVQLHPVTDQVYCCNFLRYYPGRPLKIPVTLINEEESPALKRDGYLIPINRFVECVVDEGVDIPEQLEVECTGLQFRNVIRLDRVMFPEGVRASEKTKKTKDFMIGPIHGGKSGFDDDETEGTAAEEEK